MKPVAQRLEPLLLRVPPEFVEQLRAMSSETRVPMSEYLREGVADLLRKYGRLPPRPGAPT